VLLLALRAVAEALLVATGKMADPISLFSKTCTSNIWWTRLDLVRMQMSTRQGWPLD